MCNAVLLMMIISTDNRMGHSLKSALHPASHRQPVTAGPAPALAVDILNRMCLFPEVFTPPPAVSSTLGPDYGSACVQTITAAENILKASNIQVWEQHSYATTNTIHHHEVKWFCCLTDAGCLAPGRLNTVTLL